MSSDADRNAFHELIKPLREPVRALALASRDVRERRGLLPGADAPAVRELAQGARLTNGSGHSMLQDAWSHTAVLLFAAEDHIFGMCTLLRWDTMPVYAHTVLARAALEAALWAAWLSEPEVDVRVRAGRNLTLQLADLAEAAQLAQAAGRAVAVTYARDRARALQAQAEQVGLHLLPAQKKHSREIEERKPTITRLARAFLRDDPDSAEGGNAGAMLWKSYCGVAHAGFHALRTSIDSDGIEKDPFQPGVAGATFVTRSRDVQTVLAATALAYAPAMASYVRLMGWYDEAEWAAAAQELFASVRRVFPSPNAGEIDQPE